MLQLNFDGSALGNPRKAGLGGVVRDEVGITLSYSGPVGFCSINKAELLALNLGLREASHMNPQRLLVEGDSTCVIQWALNPSTAPWYLEDMAQMSRALNISLSHIRHSANVEADKLVKGGVYKPSLIISIC